MADKSGPPPAPTVQDWLETKPQARDCLSMMKAANHCLAADDPHKFTRKDLELLERCRASVGWKHEEEVGALADRIKDLLQET